MAIGNNQKIGEDKYILVEPATLQYEINEYDSLTGVYVYATKDSKNSLDEVIAQSNYSFQEITGTNYIVFDAGYPLEDFYSFKLIEPLEEATRQSSIVNISDINPSNLNNEFNNIIDYVKKLQDEMNKKELRIDGDEDQVMLPKLEKDQFWLKTETGYRATTFADFEKEIQAIFNNFFGIIGGIDPSYTFNSVTSRNGSYILTDISTGMISSGLASQTGGGEPSGTYTVFNCGFVKIPDAARDDQGNEFVIDTYYYNSTSVPGGFNSTKPVNFSYRRVFRCIEHEGEKWALLDMTPEDKLTPPVIQGGQKIYPDVADMIGDPSIVLGEVVKLQGYYAVGDGGGHERIFSSTPGPDPIPFNSGYANLIHKDIIDLRSIGFKCDGNLETEDINKLNDFNNVTFIAPENSVINVNSTALTITNNVSLDFKNSEFIGNIVVGGSPALTELTSFSEVTLDFTAGSAYSYDFGLTETVDDNQVISIVDIRDYSYKNENLDTARPYYKDGEFFKIIKQLPNKNLYLTKNIETHFNDSDFGNNIKMFKVDFSVSNIKLKGIKFNGNQTTAIPLKVLGSSHIEFEDIEVSNSLSSAMISLSSCYNLTFKNTKTFFYDIEKTSGSTDYGLVIGNSQGIFIYDCDFVSRRHGSATGNGDLSSTNGLNIVCRNINYVNCSFQSYYSYSSDAHGNTENVNYTNCTFYRGISVSCKGVKISNSTIFQDSFIGIGDLEITNSVFYVSNRTGFSIRFRLYPQVTNKEFMKKNEMIFSNNTFYMVGGGASVNNLFEIFSSNENGLTPGDDIISQSLNFNNCKFNSPAISLQKRTREDIYKLNLELNFDNCSFTVDRGYDIGSDFPADIKDNVTDFGDYIRFSHCNFKGYNKNETLDLSQFAKYAIVEGCIFEDIGKGISHDFCEYSEFSNNKLYNSYLVDDSGVSADKATLLARFCSYAKLNYNHIIRDFSKPDIRHFEYYSNPNAANTPSGNATEIIVKGNTYNLPETVTVQFSGSTVLDIVELP